MFATIVGCLVLLLPFAVVFVAPITTAVSFPSTDSIARQYVAAIIRQDTEAAAKLGATARCPCSDTGLLQLDVERDIARFGGVEIRNLVVAVRVSTGSDESPQFALITFEYRIPGTDTWQPGKMHLDTDHEALAPRCLCGNNVYHGP
jgi:hypothetical protein